jgi:hypothetical protein
LTVSNSALQVLEGQITWFVYMVGAIIKGRLTTGSTDTQEVMDGDLSARVLKLLLVVDSPILMQACYYPPLYFSAARIAGPCSAQKFLSFP